MIFGKTTSKRITRRQIKCRGQEETRKKREKSSAKILKDKDQRFVRGEKGGRWYMVSIGKILASKRGASECPVRGSGRGHTLGFTRSGHG